MVVKRSEVAESDKWNIKAMYADLDAWKAEADQVLHPKAWESLLQYKGRLGESPAVLKEFFEKTDAFERKLDKLYTYAHLGHDQETTQEGYKDAYGRVQSAYFLFAEAFSWVEPEILSLSFEELDALITSSELKAYQFALEKLKARKPHVLSAKEEKILSLAMQPLQASHKAFSALDNADISFGKIKDSKGKEHELSHASYQVYLRQADRTLRQNAFEGIMSAYAGHENTLCELLQGAVQGHKMQAVARNYDSCLQAALKPKNIPESVYHSLIEGCAEGLKHHHRYNALRKKLMGVEELKPFDLYVSLLPEVKEDYPYQQACDFVIESMAPLGDAYQEILAKGLREDGWVDRYENADKRSGAYSSGCYDSSPYILMNYKGILNHVFTLTHEAGHSMHSYFSRKTQPYHYGQYSIFVAEVASTFHEELLLQYMLKRAKTPQERFFLLNQKLDDIRGTLFRQTMFAEFELLVHELVERGETLTPHKMKEAYKELVAKYMGPAVSLGDEIFIEWARIPHFYYNFYVYQYATGISAALTLADKVQQGGQKERDQYLKFLGLGGSCYPIDQLKVAGVDMTKPEPVSHALEKFGSILDELEKTAEEVLNSRVG